MESILKSKIFDDIQYVDHFFSTRVGGVSKGKYESLNLCTKSGDSSENVGKNLSILALKMNLPIKRFIWANQIHKDDIIKINASDSEEKIPGKTADSMVTDKQGVLICVKTADCCPILLASTEKKVVACIHSGWKGTLIQNLQKTILFLEKEFSLDKKFLRMAIGPAISKSNYKIDRERFNKFSKIIKFSKDFIVRKDSDFYIDLKGINRQIALNSGIPEENIEVLPYCTFENPDLFYSFRRDGQNSGRHLSGIMLK